MENKLEYEAGREIRHPWSAAIVPRTIEHCLELQGSGSPAETWNRIFKQIFMQMTTRHDVMGRVLFSYLLTDPSPLSNCVAEDIQQQLRTISPETIQHDSKAAEEVRFLSHTIHQFLGGMTPTPRSVTNRAEGLERSQDNAISLGVAKNMVLGSSFADVPEEEPARKRRKGTDVVPITELEKPRKPTERPPFSFPFQVVSLQARCEAAMKDEEARANATVIRPETAVADPKWGPKAEQPLGTFSTSSDDEDNQDRERKIGLAEINGGRSGDDSAALAAPGELVSINGHLQVRFFKEKPSKIARMKTEKLEKAFHSHAVPTEHSVMPPPTESGTAVSAMPSDAPLLDADEKEATQRRRQRQPAKGRNCSRLPLPVVSMEGVETKSRTEMRALLEQWMLSPTLREAFLIAVESPPPPMEEEAI